VHDVGRRDDGSVYVVSKYIEGGTLADKIAGGRPEFDESAQLIATCAMALGHAHEKRLIHRDVKPANILIEVRTDTPYVADFGLAIREEDYAQGRGLAGTPAYMSEEELATRLDRIETLLSNLVQQERTKEFYTTSEVAKILGRAEFTVREWCRLHRIMAEKRECGRGKSKEWMISHNELERIRNEGLLPL
jgi:serine/threonine protein kinase